MDSGLLVRCARASYEGGAVIPAIFNYNLTLTGEGRDAAPCLWSCSVCGHGLDLTPRGERREERGSL